MQTIHHYYKMSVKIRPPKIKNKRTRKTHAIPLKINESWSLVEIMYKSNNGRCSIRQIRLQPGSDVSPELITNQDYRLARY